MKRRKRKKVVRVSLRQANLKRRLRRHLAALGFHKSQDGRLEASGDSKDVIRALHSAQRSARLKINRAFIAERLPELIKYFASGSDIDPARISPALKKVASDTWESDLFRLAPLTWSVPVSNGWSGSGCSGLRLGMRTSTITTNCARCGGDREPVRHAVPGGAQEGSQGNHSRMLRRTCTFGDFR
jgi:hypothetical protein